MSAVFLDSSDKPVLITASDTAKLAYNGSTAKCKAISVSVAGDLAISNSEGTKVVIPAASLAIGIMHPIKTERIWLTGTTATGIVAWF
jgi:hypothetical protein